MPDISKLPDLAELLEITIDELLGAPSRVIQKLIVNDTVIMDKAENDTVAVTANEIIEAAPLLTPQQVDAVIAESNPDFNADEFRMLVEYASDDCIDEVAMSIYRRNGLSALHPIADYISDDNWDDIAMEEYRKNGLVGVKTILDCISEDCIDDIAQDLLQKEGIGAIKPIINYVSEDIIDEYIKKKYMK